MMDESLDLWMDNGEKYELLNLGFFRSVDHRLANRQFTWVFEGANVKGFATPANACVKSLASSRLPTTASLTPESELQRLL
jgi:hypothetical protein